MSSTLPAPSEWGQEASRPELDRVLATVMTGVTPVWIVDEAYITLYGPNWLVTLVFPTPQGGWAQRRYRYDVPSRTLYFLGEQPINVNGLADLQRTARRLA